MLKRLAGCVRQYKGASLLSPLFVVLEVITRSYYGSDHSAADGKTD